MTTGLQIAAQERAAQLQRQAAAQQAKLQQQAQAQAMQQAAQQQEQERLAAAAQQEAQRNAMLPSAYGQAASAGVTLSPGFTIPWWGIALAALGFGGVVAARRR